MSDYMPDITDVGEQEHFCLSCDDYCALKVVDNGIGPYEFWGDCRTHHDYSTESYCCGDAYTSVQELPEGHWARIEQGFDEVLDRTPDEQRFFREVVRDYKALTVQQCTKTPIARLYGAYLKLEAEVRYYQLKQQEEEE